MKFGFILSAALLIGPWCYGQAAPATPAASTLTCTHFVDGKWFNGSGFETSDFYSQQGLLTHKACRPAHEIDLQGHYIVPPYGDAHEHNFDSVSQAKRQNDLFLRDGIFYAQGMTDVTSGSVEVRKANLVNTLTTVSVTYAHGGLTGFNGHPKEVYEALALSIYTGLTDEQRAQVVAAHKRLGDAYWEMETPSDLEIAWPKILAAKPDLIKIYLTDSEHWKPRSATDPQLGRGLNPTLVPLITAKAHAAGLKVAAHIDTATDFHIAVTGGVDEMGHLPGYGIYAKENTAKYHLSDEDIGLCAKRHVAVQATASLAVNERVPMEDLRVRERSQIDNLSRLKSAGVTILIGSDNYGSDSVHEADYLRSLGLWTNLEMLRMWSITTPKAIFPKRKIGSLQQGSEASFLVLTSNPLQSWSETHHILDRWKQGVRIPVQTAP